MKKLKIETHTSNNKKGINNLKINKTPNLKNIKFYKNLFKARLEDRNRIKAISFSTNKKEKDDFLLYKLKKNEEASTFEFSEANYLRALRDYNQLKHEIYLKEQKEKKIKNNEAIFNEKMVKRDINYTFIKETLYQFMRFKTNHNIYNTNLLKNQDQIKRAKKTGKSNFINKTIKSVTRGFHSINGKIDMGMSRHEEILNEKEYDHLIEQISKSRLKHLKSFHPENTNPNTDAPLRKMIESNKSLNITYKIQPFNNYFQNNNKENKKLELGENAFREKLKKNYKHITEKQLDIKTFKDFDLNCKTDSNINKGFINDKKNKPESEKSIGRNSHQYNFKREKEKRAKSSKYKTYILSKPMKLNYFSKNNSLKKNIFDNKNIEKDNESKCSIISESDESIKERNKSNESSLIIKDLINFERMKQNNFMKEKKNPAYWNYNIKRLNTAGNRNHKIINKPLYVSKISDFIKEYKRIKSVSKKAKKRMREKHFTTLENIDKISQTKEDLLMFILKMKFFNCKFPSKKIKTISKKDLFVKKLRNYLNIIDNPYSPATREIKAELRKFDGL